MASGWRSAVLVCVALASTACQRHVRLEFPDSSPGEEYVCRVTESQQERCEPRTVLDAARDNRQGTVFVILPRACQGKFHQIVIHDAGSTRPTVAVKCSPLENVIE